MLSQDATSGCFLQQRERTKRRLEVLNNLVPKDEKKQLVDLFHQSRNHWDEQQKHIKMMWLPGFPQGLQKSCQVPLS